MWQSVSRAQCTQWAVVRTNTMQPCNTEIVNNWFCCKQLWTVSTTASVWGAEVTQTIRRRIKDCCIISPDCANIPTYQLCALGATMHISVVSVCSLVSHHHTSKMIIKLLFFTLWLWLSEWTWVNFHVQFSRLSHNTALLSTHCSKVPSTVGSRRR